MRNVRTHSEHIIQFQMANASHLFGLDLYLSIIPNDTSHIFHHDTSNGTCLPDSQTSAPYLHLFPLIHIEIDA